MIAARVAEEGSIETVETENPKVGSHDVLIEVKASGICGTDVHIYHGEFNATYPLIPGHEFSGKIVEVGPEVTHLEPGDSVAVEPNIPCDNCDMCLNNRQNFCRNWQAIGVTRSGAMAQYVAVPEKSAFRIGQLSYDVAAFVEPLSCVIHGLDRAKPVPGARILIVGAGPIGIMLLRFALLEGARQVDVVDRIRSRLDFATASGASATGANLEECPSDSYDLVIDASGSPGVLPKTLELVRSGGTALWFGVPPKGRRVEIEPFVVFSKELTLLSSFTSLRNTYQAISLLQAGRIQVDDLISHRLSLQEFRMGIELIEGVSDGVMKVMLYPNG